MAATQARPEEWVYAKPFEDMPGPKPLPVIGNVWRFIPYLGKIFFSLRYYGYAQSETPFVRSYV
jgi:hypothetical protein